MARTEAHVPTRRGHGISDRLGPSVEHCTRTLHEKRREATWHHLVPAPWHHTWSPPAHDADRHCPRMQSLGVGQIAMHSVHSAILSSAVSVSNDWYSGAGGA